MLTIGWIWVSCVCLGGTNGNREFGDVYSTLSNLSLAGGSMVYYQNGNSNVVNPLYMSRLAAPNLEWEKN